MKSYTDLEQSKKLAEILPLESADMYYFSNKNCDNIECGFDYTKRLLYVDYGDGLPCWSLAALIDVLPSATLDSSSDHYYRLYCMTKYTEWYDNPIDACVEMINKLYELNLL